MKVLVTGASGFLGKAVVCAAMEAGHQVYALARPASDTTLANWPEGVMVIWGDLRQVSGWAHELEEIEGLVHLAAATSGDLATQLGGTVVGTENLLKALNPNRLERMVLVSSFSVYDFSGLDGVVTEDAPMQAISQTDDPYTIAKIIQEQLVVAECRAKAVGLVVLRPGLIFGLGKDWSFGRAARVGSRDVIFSPNALMPLTFVANCADAVVRALSPNVPSGTVCNVVDDQLPTRRQYHRLCRQAGARTGKDLGVPWWLVRVLGLAASAMDRIFFGGRAKLPDILARRRQAARWKPLRYSNARIRRQLGWLPQVGLHEAVARTVGCAETHAGLECLRAARGMDSSS